MCRRNDTSKKNFEIFHRKTHWGNSTKSNQTNAYFTIYDDLQTTRMCCKNCMDKRFARFTEQKKKIYFYWTIARIVWELTQSSHKVKLCARAKSFPAPFCYVRECGGWMIGKKCLATNSLLAKTCMRVEFNMANYGCKAGGNSDTFNACPHFPLSPFFYFGFGALVCLAFFLPALLLFHGWLMHGRHN